MGYSISAARILLLFRDQKAIDWNSLCIALGVHGPSMLFHLRGIVRELTDAKLLIIDNYDTSTFVKNFIYGQNNEKIRLADNVPQIFSILNLSMTAMSSLDSHNSMFVEPVFGRPNPIKPEKRLDLFVLMPFIASMKAIYEDHIKRIAAKPGLKVARADDFFAAHTVMEDVWATICESELIIADCTGRNPNVFYEIGLAHTVGKPVVLISQNAEDIPFDIRQYRYILYEYTPRGMLEFESKLASTIKTEFEKKGREIIF